MHTSNFLANTVPSRCNGMEKLTFYCPSVLLFHSIFFQIIFPFYIYYTSLSKYTQEFPYDPTNSLPPTSKLHILIFGSSSSTFLNLKRVCPIVNTRCIIYRLIYVELILGKRLMFTFCCMLM